MSVDVIAAFLDGQPDRRLLVLVLDGMCWADAVELLASLDRNLTRWSPLQWRLGGRAKGTQGRLPPVLAALPTTTEVSRAALFAGQLLPRGKREKRRGEDLLWAANPALAPYVPSGTKPTLLLGGDAAGGSGLTDASRRAIASEQRVVAMVLNEVDQALRGNVRTRLPCTIGTLPALRQALKAAEEHRRAVLVCSDHGHVPGATMKRIGVEGERSSRWRELRTGEDADEGAIEVTPPARSASRGASRIALLWDDRLSWTQPTAGCHGGASLAEVVAPALLLGTESLTAFHAAESDSQLRLAVWNAPAWWELEAPPEEHPEPRTETPAAVEADGQLTMLAIQPDRPGGEDAQRSSDFVRRIVSSSVFRALRVDAREDDVRRTISALEILVAAGDKLGAAPFARQLGIEPHQLVGWVARIGDLLNRDGFAAIEYDAAGEQVRIRREVLEQNYLEDV